MPALPVSTKLLRRADTHSAGAENRAPVAVLRRLGALVVSAALAGCYMPGAQRHAELRIAADGSYRFNGQAATLTELSARIAAAGQPGGDLVVQIEPSASADLAAVRRAVEAVKAAHARVAFAAAAS